APDLAIRLRQAHDPRAQAYLWRRAVIEPPRRIRDGLRLVARLIGRRDENTCKTNNYAVVNEPALAPLALSHSGASQYVDAPPAPRPPARPSRPPRRGSGPSRPRWRSRTGISLPRPRSPGPGPPSAGPSWWPSWAGTGASTAAGSSHPRRRGPARTSISWTR